MDNYDMGPMLTVSEVAKLLHVHSITARRWANQGVIKTSTCRTYLGFTKKTYLV
jgi:predicted site-specific integrase-resolvase